VEWDVSVARDESSLVLIRSRFGSRNILTYSYYAVFTRVCMHVVQGCSAYLYYSVNVRRAWMSCMHAVLTQLKSIVYLQGV